MELRQLEYFVAVAEERSFTRGAARMHVVQSAVSAAIKALEQELLTPLLNRTTKRVDLTEAGSVLLPEARAILQAVAGARDAVEAVRGGLRGTVRVGTMTSVGLVDLAGILEATTACIPTSRCGSPPEPRARRASLEGIEDRSLDLALVSVSTAPREHVALFDIADVPIDLVVPSSHPFARRHDLRLRDLVDVNFIDSPGGYGNRTVIDRAFADAQPSRRVTMEPADVGTFSDFVAHGLGVAFVPRFAISASAAVSVVPVRDAHLTWSMSLAVPTDRRPSAAATALIDLIRASLPARE